MDKTKILSNPATLLIGDSGGVVSAVGYTRGGVSISKTYGSRDITADQTRFPLYKQTTDEGYDISFKLMEITAQNLKDAWGEAGAVASGSLSLGVYAENPPEKEIQIYAKNKAGDYVKFTFYDCVLSSTEALNYSRDEEALIGSTFSALYSDTNGCVGLFEEAATV